MLLAAAFSVIALRQRWSGPFVPRAASPSAATTKTDESVQRHITGRYLFGLGDIAGTARLGASFAPNGGLAFAAFLLTATFLSGCPAGGIRFIASAARR